MSFKVGDKVLVLDSAFEGDSFCAKTNTIYTIKRIEARSSITVVWFMETQQVCSIKHVIIPTELNKALT
jgi:hypothetical protein